jgi:hypothetical protein
MVGLFSYVPLNAVHNEKLISALQVAQPTSIVHVLTFLPPVGSSSAGWVFIIIGEVKWKPAASRGLQLVTTLVSRGLNVYFISFGEKYRFSEKKKALLGRALEKGDIQKSIEAVESASEPCAAIIHATSLWQLFLDANGGSYDGLTAVQNDGCLSALQAVKLVMSGPNPRRLYVVTTAAHSSTGRVVCALALEYVLQTEAPSLRGNLGNFANSKMLNDKKLNCFVLSVSYGILPLDPVSAAAEGDRRILAAHKSSSSDAPSLTSPALLALEPNIAFSGTSV